MTTIKTLDLRFLDLNHCIAAFLVSDGDFHCLVETGPFSTITSLEKGLLEQGLTLKDINKVFLSHIHFDHAGAAWHLAQTGADVYVHPAGYRHLVSPEKLVASATMIYGDKMDSLWGRIEGIPENRLFTTENGEVIRAGNLEFTAWHTPGHASHHIAWQLGDVLFTGDMAGIRVEGGPVVPPCPPPDFDLELWKQSIELVKTLNIKTLYLTHFGKYENTSAHWEELTRTLDTWALAFKKLMEKGLALPEATVAFGDFIKQDLRDRGIKEEVGAIYEGANPSFMAAMGLWRYWSKRNSV